MEYEVEIIRIGYASSVFKVDAASAKEAEVKAIEKAHNAIFSEHISEYKVCGYSELGVDQSARTIRGQ